MALTSTTFVYVCVLCVCVCVCGVRLTDPSVKTAQREHHNLSMYKSGQQDGNKTHLDTLFTRIGRAPPWRRLPQALFAQTHRICDAHLHLQHQQRTVSNHTRARKRQGHFHAPKHTRGQANPGSHTASVMHTHNTNSAQSATTRARGSGRDTSTPQSTLGAKQTQGVTP